jgi:probable HAF family extracellular repeat protein
VGHGFVFAAGQMVSFDVPDAAPDGTAANGINARGQIVGGFVDVDGNSHGFLATGSSYTTLDCPGGIGTTTAWSINSAGQIAGTCEVAGQRVGFVANPVTIQKP